MGVTASAIGNSIAVGQVVAAASTNGPLDYSFDLSSISKADIALWRASKDPRVNALAETAAQARVAYADYISEGARLSINTNAGNGYFPVLTLVAPNYSPSRFADVHTHYHGWQGVVGDNAADQGRLQMRIREVQAADPQVVFVLPECANAPSFAGVQTPWYKTNWSNATNEGTTTTAALNAAGIRTIGERTLSMFSGGGAAFTSLMAAKPDGSGIIADRIEADDSLYGSEVDLAKFANTQSGSSTHLSYVHGVNDLSEPNPVPVALRPAGKLTRTALLEKAFASRYTYIEAKTESSLIGNNKPAVKANGKPYHTATGQPIMRLPTLVGADIVLHVSTRTLFMHSPERDT